jgi:hypothetical protein
MAPSAKGAAKVAVNVTSGVVEGVAHAPKLKDAVEGCAGAIVGTVMAVVAVESSKKKGSALTLEIGEPSTVTVVTTERDIAVGIKVRAGGGGG